jgi:hypothetical protein
MPDRRFPICSVPVPACIGREPLLARLQSSLTKPAPDHLQVIGARFAGKTVLLTELIQRLRAAGGPYTAVVHWDLGHRTPADDVDFLQGLRIEISEALKVRHSEYGTHLRSTDGAPYGELSMVLDLLKDEGKVLAVLDGFDRALTNGRLTRNLWDQMRELAAKPSLRLVTASRRTLRELIRHPDAQTSDFWNIFDPSPIRVGCFDEQDLDAVLQSTAEFQLSAGARTELLGATNGYPILALEVLNAIASSNHHGEVSLDAMRGGIDEAYAMVRDRLDAIWEDCPSTARDLFRLVNEHSHIPRAEAPGADVECLLERGFVHLSGNRLQRPNRLLARFLSEVPNDATAMARLFGATPAYETNLGGVFERRIAQIDGLDATLRRYLSHGVEDLPHHPDVCLTHVRGFVDRVFELIWQAEIPDKCIPAAWLDAWKHSGERGINDWGTTSVTFPQGVHRVRLLNLMMGTQRSARTARKVFRGTYALMNGAYAFGEMGQHQDGMRIDVGTGYAALHLCIELAASLQRDLLAAP